MFRFISKKKEVRRGSPLELLFRIFLKADDLQHAVVQVRLGQ